MNRYGRQAHNHYLQHRPDELARMADPAAHFTTIGDQAQMAITDLRDQILGTPEPTESPEDYRQRSYQALRQAEEIVLTDLLPPPESNDPAVPSTAPGLQILSETLSTLDADWTETPASTP